jgi:thiol-disulfide isomerase/thioredoxin
MKRVGFFAIALLALCPGVFAQSMMSTSAANNGVAGMSAAVTPAADSAVGHQLRVARSTGHKVIFTTLDAALALAAKGPTILFFAADWCPYCQADLKDINTHGNKISDVSIIVVDYDTARDLENTYGVTVQDTFVQIDAKGVKLAIWNGGGVDGIKTRLVRG